MLTVKGTSDRRNLFYQEVLHVLDLCIFPFTQCVNLITTIYMRLKYCNKKYAYI